MILRSILLSITVLGLAACGGASFEAEVVEADPAVVEADAEVVKSDANLNDFDASLNSFEERLVSLDRGDLSSESYAALSAAGGATYTGGTAIYFDIDDVDVENISGLPEPALVGQFSLETSFKGLTDIGALNGTMTDFVDSDDNAKSGALTIEDGTIVSAEGEVLFVALIDGTLAGGGVGSRRYQGVAVGGFVTGGEIFGIGAGGPTDTLDLENIDALNFDEPDYIMVFSGSKN
jgi:hypothetical protein